MIFKSNVKVNIGLKIVGIRSDGYHNISTIFQELDCGDVLKIHNLNSGFELSSNLRGSQKDLITDEVRDLRKEVSELKEMIKLLIQNMSF